MEKKRERVNAHAVPKWKGCAAFELESPITAVQQKSIAPLWENPPQCVCVCGPAVLGMSERVRGGGEFATKKGP